MGKEQRATVVCKCNQTKENCECHIPDVEKHQGLFNMHKIYKSSKLKK